MESNPLSPYKSTDDRLWRSISLCHSPILNESHTVSVRGLVSISFPFRFQFFSRLAALFAEERGKFHLFASYGGLI